MTSASVPPTPPPPAFTVAMTVLNMERFLAGSLASILPQVPPDGELVVVDACSNDGTTEHLRSLEHEGKLRLHVEACSRGRGRQIAMSLARGRAVVTQVDADVRYAPGVLRDAVEEHARRGRPGVLIVVGRRDRDPSTSKVLVWDLATYRSLPGYPDWPFAEEIEALRSAVMQGRAQRYLVDLVGEDIGQLTGQRTVNDRPWRRGLLATMKVTRHRYGEGWTFRGYARFLWLTRRTVPRFLAGVGVAALARLQPPLRYDHLSKTASGS